MCDLTIKLLINWASEIAGMIFTVLENKSYCTAINSAANFPSSGLQFIDNKMLWLAIDVNAYLTEVVELYVMFSNQVFDIPEIP